MLYGMQGKEVPKMATESFEKDFIITEEQAPLWKAALEKLEQKKLTYIPKKEQDIPSDELLDFLKRAKSWTLMNTKLSP